MNLHTASFSVRGLRILRVREVVARTGLSRSTLWRLERKGHFPARRQISAGAVGWLESEIEDFLASRPEKLAVGLKSSWR